MIAHTYKEPVLSFYFVFRQLLNETFDLTNHLDDPESFLIFQTVVGVFLERLLVWVGVFIDVDEGESHGEKLVQIVSFQVDGFLDHGVQFFEFLVASVLEGFDEFEFFLKVVDKAKSGGEMQAKGLFMNG
jgi:hypothetical protein